MAGLRKLHAVDGRSGWRKVSTIYFDTADRTLKDAGFALRLRRTGRRWVQTVKIGSGPQAGLVNVAEYETPAPGGHLSLAAIPDEAARERISLLLEGRALSPVCESVVRRNAVELLLSDGTRAEICLDIGEIRSGAEHAPIQEVEFELKEGDVNALYELASELVPEPALRLSRLSKAARGYLLADAGIIEPASSPRMAKKVLLKPSQTAELAARDVLRECFDQVISNVTVVLQSDDPEGPHQLRVGLRRLRAAFAMFAEPLGSPALCELADGARSLGRTVGPLRDLDVAATDMVRPLADAHPQEPGFAALSAALIERAAMSRKRLRENLHEPATQEFLLHLARFIETRGWLLNHDLEQTQRLAEPVSELAARSLDAHYAKVVKRAKKLEQLTVEQRHALRKKLKALRYVVEFSAPLYPKKKVKEFTKRLKRMQEVFGALNDVAVAQALLTGDHAPGHNNPAAQRASGWLIGNSLVRAEMDWTRAQGAMSEFMDVPPFWRTS